MQLLIKMEEIRVGTVLKLRGKILGFLLYLVGVVLNSIEIQILRTTSDKPFYEKILLSLTICDLIYATLGSASLLFVSISENTSYYGLLWNISSYGICFSALVSLLHLIFISLEKLWAIHSPLHHRKYNSSKKKLIIALVTSWGVPTLFMLISAIYIMIQDLTIEEVYYLLINTIFSVAANIMVVADLVLLSSYGAIIYITFSKEKEKALRHQEDQSRFGNTLILCMSIVLIFIVLTTPFVVAFLTPWNIPNWYRILSMGLFVLNQISNSIVFLIQRYRSQRSTNISDRSIQANVEGTRF